MKKLFVGALVAGSLFATGTYGFDLAIKPVIEIDRLLDYRASKRDRETAAQTLKILGATIRRREDNE